MPVADARLWVGLQARALLGYNKNYISRFMLKRLDVLKVTVQANKSDGNLSKLTRSTISLPSFVYVTFNRRRTAA
jgi:hypothetical protein